MSIRSILMLGVVLGSVLVTSACGVQTRKPDQDTATAAVAKVTYVKDPRTGECYGVTMSAELGKPNADGMTITWVPCSPGVVSQIGE